MGQNTITLDLDNPEDIARLRAILGVQTRPEPRVIPATLPKWAPGRDGKGEWVLQVAEDDFREHPVPYPIPRIVDVPDIHADGMDQFSAWNTATKKSIYESKGYLEPPEPGSVTCPREEYVRLMDRYNGDQKRSKKPGHPVTPDAIPGPWGNAKQKKPKAEDGRVGA